ncbi:hypothetical protein MKW98_027316 [Papaver atlanticum]|uniref:Uncharacterized protein n=1 Tax=Papaver atlanticum TaxID=357466 RepID=A0AAD4XK13_9MAGN|nr:hypothetical protein MKW98_027316 [Papaver atlanticum]
MDTCYNKEEDEEEGEGEGGFMDTLKLTLSYDLGHLFHLLDHFGTPSLLLFFTTVTSTTIITNPTEPGFQEH